MAIVTISREFGSAGSEIARKAAEELGYSLVDKETVGRLLAGYGLVDFGRAYEAESGFWNKFDDRRRTIVDMLDRVAKAVARRGRAVILGRGFYLSLAGLPGLINVRIRAPFEWRVARVLEESSDKDRRKAEAAVREGDRIRSSFVSSVYGARWDSMEGFDLVIDSSKIGIGRAASWIALAAGDLDAAGRGASSAVSAADFGKPDPVLDEAVAAELGEARPPA
jgi:cytidylate kinase